MRYIISITAFLLIFSSCNNNSADKKESSAQTVNTNPKGEFAFLLKYNGQMPSDVGFLTNHVVERRLANMMKDSFQVLMSKTKFDRPIMVSEESQTVAAVFFSDSDRLNPSAQVTIDVAKDAIWASYYQGDSLIEFADHPELTNPME